MRTILTDPKGNAYGLVVILAGNSPLPDVVRNSVTFKYPLLSGVHKVG